MANITTLSLSTKVIERFLHGEDLEKFLQTYNDHKKGFSGNKRGVMLQQPLTKEEFEILEYYIKDTDKPLKQFAEEKGLSMGSVFGRASRIALRVIAQHVEILNKIQVQKD